VFKIAGTLMLIQLPYFLFLQPAKVTAHYFKGTTFMIKFDESVIARDKLVEGK